MAALLPAALAIIVLRGDQRKQVILHVDRENILFFAELFVLIGGLEKVQVFEKLVEGLAHSTSANPTGLVMGLHWGPGLASGIVDNVLGSFPQSGMWGWQEI